MDCPEAPATSPERPITARVARCPASREGPLTEPHSGRSAWAARTPDDFVVTVKASRYLTHVKRLNDVEEPVDRFVDRTRHLGTKLL